jgi:cellobiose phosphorylase
MKKESEGRSLWKFVDNHASFRFPSPTEVSRLYFPLANEAGILSSITPDLHGDIKTSHNSYLTLPVSVEDLHNTKSNRNFWVYVESKGAWSLTGVSAMQDTGKFSPKDREKVTLEAGMLWHKVTRESSVWKLKSEIINFAPASPDRVEIMMVNLTNTGGTRLRITCTSGIPIFGRSADNLRDHQHVTSLLHRIISHPSGVVVKPTMSFDERGHKLNEISYAVLGFQENGQSPEGSFSTVPDFIGEGGDFETPRSVLENWPLPQKDESAYQGKSAMGALRFKNMVLAPGKTARFVLILGVAEKDSEVDGWIRKFGSTAKAELALKENKAFWSHKLDALHFQTQDSAFNDWMRWVCLQPTLRKIFGNSFLPDFDYGRGGRGWRDLWQDCLALLLTSPPDTRKILVTNFNGVRIDGSNATIIGAGSGEFIADRNNITRVWMDHGTWPYLTVELYIHQTGDLDILFEKANYFRDKQLSRSRAKDSRWTENDGKKLKTKRGVVAQGTVLEHLLVQHLVQFFNVGDHNHIRLENADWNDGLDMAYEKGESVAFTCLYGSNLRKLAELLEEVARRKNIKKVLLAKELLLLLDRVTGARIKYDSAAAKQKILKKYFDAVQPKISGTKRQVIISKLVKDLREKSDSIMNHVRKTEWMQISRGDACYNGYYDNQGRRVEGDFPEGFRMTLAGQTFPVMSGVATVPQVRDIFRTAKKYLKDKIHGGFRLNTDFHQIRLDLGRAFSFAYGEKENGAFFSHMAVMFANALYQRGFVNEGREVLQSIYRMCLRTDKSKIYPGIPEYFNSEGRGLYHYLTGSASWLILTLLTQVFGIRGYFGDLLIAPKFTREDFLEGSEISAEALFAGVRYKIIYANPKKLSYEHYAISKVVLNDKDFKAFPPHQKEVLISKETLARLGRKSGNTIRVTLE